jgi:hypothetical protein
LTTAKCSTSSKSENQIVMLASANAKNWKYERQTY